MKKKLIITLILICSLFINGCKKEDIPNPIVTMTIKDYGEITIELYPNIAYNTVANFVNLIEDGFYNNNTFHRLVPGFALQGGDPTATGSGSPGYSIKGEFPINGVNNSLSHTKGIISMARSQDYNSAGSQFFIVLDDSAALSLDGEYAAFGRVTEGMDVIEDIENDTHEYKDANNGILKNPLILESATVDTKGHKYTVKKIETN